MANAEHFVTRWERAGLLDESTAASIRSYEGAQAAPAGRQWQVLLALILGGILLGAGVLLFVAAHWDTVSPTVRTLLVLAMLPFFHGLGFVVRERFAGLATALHGLGTIASGAAIALVGQIFNMQEHWPAAVLLWALCAAAGWMLLRDEIQETLTLLLAPAWIVSEWAYRTNPFTGSAVYLGRMVAVIGVVYLTAFLRTRKQAVFGILFGVGAIMLPVAVGMLAEGWAPGFDKHWGFIPLGYRLTAGAIMLGAAAAGARLERSVAIPAVVFAALAWALPWCQTTVVEHFDGGRSFERTYTHSEPSLLFYVVLAAACIFLVAWGVRTLAKPLVNYGIVAFALTVVWFYFSSVMDKLNRSLGLILLGVLFLAGGWALERTRRRLVRRMNEGVNA